MYFRDEASDVRMDRLRRAAQEYLAERGPLSSLPEGHGMKRNREYQRRRYAANRAKQVLLGGGFHAVQCGRSSEEQRNADTTNAKDNNSCDSIPAA
jgi:hypothetical protein